MMRAVTGAAGTLLLAAQVGAVQTTASAEIDSRSLARDVSVLAADSMAGRATGTAGNAAARAYILARFADAGLRPLASGYEAPFPIRGGEEGEPTRGINVVGQVRGSAMPERWIVVTAHYDHLGVSNGQTFNGADDNASGVAGLLALAEWAVRNPPRHSILFVAFDAEERGLVGARAFVASPPVPRSSMAINVNLDMIGRNDAGELYVAGTAHYPTLAPLVDSITATAPVRLLRGHDRPGSQPGDDWTSASDHAPFHQVGIPFLYFGVEDHADYHRPTDDAERIQPDFHARAVETVRRVIEALDEQGEMDASASGGTDASARGVKRFFAITSGWSARRHIDGRRHGPGLGPPIIRSTWRAAGHWRNGASDSAVRDVNLTPAPRPQAVVLFWAFLER